MADDGPGSGEAQLEEKVMDGVFIGKDAKRSAEVMLSALREDVSTREARKSGCREDPRIFDGGAAWKGDA